MRTKTLLMSAAALAVGVISSQAQTTVYSQNVVGYVNSTLTPGSFGMLAPALDLDGSGTNNTISTVVGTNVAVNTEVLVWNGAGFDTLTYGAIPGQRGGAPTWWTSVSGVNTGVPNYPLNCGTGFFIDDPTDTNVLQTGVVISGTVTNNLTSGQDALVGSIIPYGGDIKTNLNYVANVNDEVLIWNGSGYNTYTYGVIPGQRGGSDVWWTPIAGVNTAQDPQISVGQGFFIVPAANNVWTETFTNN